MEVCSVFEISPCRHCKMAIKSSAKQHTGVAPRSETADNMPESDWNSCIPQLPLSSHRVAENMESLMLFPLITPSSHTALGCVWTGVTGKKKWATITSYQDTKSKVLITVYVYEQPPPPTFKHISCLTCMHQSSYSLCILSLISITSQHSIDVLFSFIFTTLPSAFP